MICFNCGKYGHTSESCPNIFQPSEHTNPPSPATKHVQDITDSDFGPWMIVEKRQRRPLRKTQASESIPTNKPLSGSRFNPILEDHEEITEAINVETSNFAKPASEPAKNQRLKGKQIATKKQSRAVHICKPLSVSLNDFPIIPRPVAKASSSRSMPTQCITHIASLDASRHSSIVITENLDPNVQQMNMDASIIPASNNPLTMGKPSDQHNSSCGESGMEQLHRSQANSVVNLVQQSKALAFAMLD
ncbi:hypothetical protein V6N13_074126 [Hibiscus sabdariffa]